MWACASDSVKHLNGKGLRVKFEARLGPTTAMEQLSAQTPEDPINRVEPSCVQAFMPQSSIPGKLPPVHCALAEKPDKTDKLCPIPGRFGLQIEQITGQMQHFSRAAFEDTAHQQYVPGGISTRQISLLAQLSG